VSWEEIEQQGMTDLDRRLRGAGADGPQPKVSSVWGAVLAWAAEPVMPTDSGCIDEIEVLAAWHEPDFAGHDWSYFDAPEELGQPIFGISVSRTIHPPKTSPPADSHGVGWVDLYFEDTPLWAEKLGSDEYFLGRQPRIPAIESSGPADGLGDLTPHPLIALASSLPLLGLITENLRRVWGAAG
jgi:hypothetical protein